MKRHALPIAAIALGLAAAGMATPARAKESTFQIEITPRSITTDDPVVIDLSGVAAGSDCIPTFGAPSVFRPAFNNDSGTITIQQATVPVSQCTQGDWRQRIVVGPLKATVYDVAVLPPAYLTDAPALGHLGISVAAPQTTATLQNLSTTAFTATLTWTDPAGALHAARAVQVSSQAAFFWLFEPGNVEVTLKILDGRPVNGHFWVFIASMTDVAFDLAVTEQTAACGSGQGLPACSTRHYVNAAHQNHNTIDVTAFAGP